MWLEMAPNHAYEGVRHPLDFTSSLLEHLGLDTNVSFEDQHFFWAPGHFPRHFTPGKQRYLDHSALGLRFSGYLDASIQRWALVVDEYLQCPQDRGACWSGPWRPFTTPWRRS
eukprot:g17078.t1